MSFWKSLFGGGGAAKKEAPAPGEEYKGFTIRATPMSAGSEYQLAGVIEKTVGGELKSYKFVRADRMSSRDEAVSFALAKGRQIVDEQGEGVFRQSWPKTG
jgi:hypothetical protein